MSKMFYGCSSLDTLSIDDWDVSSCEDMVGMFVYCDESIVPQWYEN